MKRIHWNSLFLFLVTFCLPISTQAGEPITDHLSKKLIIAPASVSWWVENHLSLTGLPLAKSFPEICVYRYRVSTSSLECQQFVDQALGYYYSYVWMEAARSFETALRYDPKCAFAWYGLSKALDKWGKKANLEALQVAQSLINDCSDREKLLILARCQEKGIAPNVGPQERKKKAQASLDELLTIYEDDEEGWFARAQISEGVAAIPYYKSLLRINPLHPGANHELVHFYENYKRPALGWPYAEKYIASSPGIPHAFHMQAHLAMRIGKWDQTTNWSWRAVELEKEYHQKQSVKASDDFQFNHHMEILTRSLVHNGRFSEAGQIRRDALSYQYHFNPEWFTMFLAQEDWHSAEELIRDERKKNKSNGSYYAARLYLLRGDTKRAAAEVEVLRQALHSKKSDRRTLMRLNEVQGLLLCQQGAGDAGLKLLSQNVQKTKDDYNSHAWGMGSYQMEAWGIGALEAGNAEVAEEAFLEAIAHDAASVTAALGLRAICERLNRIQEAQSYEVLARKFWASADSRDYLNLRDRMTKRAEKIPLSGVAARSNLTEPISSVPAR